MGNTTRVLVTRPEREAGPWVEGLRTAGIDARPFPLIDIAPLTDSASLQAVWQTLPACTAVMFVSANAVRHFMASRPAAMALQCQAWGTGPGTAAALRAAGWPEALIRCPDADAPSLDSEALWALVQPERSDWTGTQVLIVRGADAQGQMAGREWLAERLRAVGVKVSQCVSYVRQTPVLDAGQLAQAATALSDGSWWLFSSSEAALGLQSLLPQAIGAQSRALATHPRIAQRLQAQGWGHVVLVPPSLAGQIASIECLA